MSRRKRWRTTTKILLLSGLLLAVGSISWLLDWTPAPIETRAQPDSLAQASAVAAAAPAAADADVPATPVPQAAPAISEETANQRTALPLMNYMVRSGDTLSELADRFDTTMEKLQEYNDGLNASDLRSGVLIKVPDKAAANGEQRPRFVWPARGPITTPFGELGWSWIGGVHTGLDIGAPEGDFVFAADKGVIVDTGTNGMGRGYGTYVLIRHSEGWFTLYAHLSKTYREIGYEVDKGENMALIGQTGFADGPHLHFEVWDFGEKLDPIQFLP